MLQREKQLKDFFLVGITFCLTAASKQLSGSFCCHFFLLPIANRHIINILIKQIGEYSETTRSLL